MTASRAFAHQLVELLFDHVEEIGEHPDDGTGY
jgi:hypothetical protein